VNAARGGVPGEPTQIATDFAASALREAIVRAASLRDQLREAVLVYGLDAALTPAPVCIIAATGKPALAAAILLPTLLLARSYAVERRRHIDTLLRLMAGEGRRPSAPIVPA
jgi:hypothetical protein